MKFAARFAITAILVAGFSSLTADTSEAQLGYGAYQQGYGGYGFGRSPYISGRVPVPPYFALHPPVYYSAPVARTYGHSPFAYPGTYRTPEIAAPTCCEPFTMTNPYVTSSSTEEAVETGDDDFASSPLVIKNPYVLDDPAEIDAEEYISLNFLD